MLAIYRDHIRRGIGPLGNYQIGEPQLDDIKRRRKNMQNQWLPHLVADLERTIVGYAYAVPFRKRPAYLHGQAFDLRSPRPSACRDRPASSRRADRCLCRGWLSADDWLR
jgi:hypothetical protein